MHGTRGCYVRGCRLWECCEANREYQREWQRAHPTYHREWQGRNRRERAKAREQARIRRRFGSLSISDRIDVIAELLHP